MKASGSQVSSERGGWTLTPSMGVVYPLGFFTRQIIQSRDVFATVLS